MEKTDISIFVAISTYGSRISMLQLPELIIPGVNYLIVHQLAGFTEGENLFSSRPDVIYRKMNVLGLSKSRNEAIRYGNGDYLYFMDDDTIIFPEKIIALCEEMRRDGAQVGTCCFKYSDGGIKKYSLNQFTHNNLTLAKVSSIEICVATKFLRENSILFNENFGIGAPYPSGEEYIFLSDLLKSKAFIKFYPIVTSIHPPVTSGQDFYSSEEKILAKREMLRIVFGKFSYIFILLFWMKKIPKVYKAGYLNLFTRTMLLGRK